MVRLPPRPVLSWKQKVWALIDSVESWKQVVLARSEEDYMWIESQAEEFASYLLAPETVFGPVLKDELAKLDRLPPSVTTEDVLPYLANPIGEYFGMSNAAAQARIRKSELWRSFAGERNGKG